MLFLALMAGMVAHAQPVQGSAEDVDRTVLDLTAGVTAYRSGRNLDATGPAPRDTDLRRTVPGGVLSVGVEGPRRRGGEAFVVVTGLFREERTNDPPLFGAATPRPTRVALGVGPRAHLRAGVDGALGTGAVDLFGSVGPIVALGLAAPDAWQGGLAPHLRLGVHASAALSTPLGGGVDLHAGWRSLLLADVTGPTQRRVDPWHLGLLTVGVRVRLGREASLSPMPSPSPRSPSPAAGRPSAGAGPG